MNTLNADELRNWIGRREISTETIAPGPLAGWSATLDRDDPLPESGDPLPPLAHWVYFVPRHRQSEIGPDGHARRGGFLPPVPLPRRMWAGGRLRFERPLKVASRIEKRSTITDVAVKAGRQGPLVFVTVLHEFYDDDGLCLAEEHDIVYRDPPPAAPSEPLTTVTAAGMAAAWCRTIRPDPVLLFRYSALTFNGHRIHYDQPYTTMIEGYPGLIVHGPLMATLLADLVRRERPAATMTSFKFRGLSPVFDTAPFQLKGVPDAGGTIALWIETSDGRRAFEATAVITE